MRTNPSATHTLMPGCTLLALGTPSSYGLSSNASSEMGEGPRPPAPARDSCNAACRAKGRSRSVVHRLPSDGQRDPEVADHRTTRVHQDVCRLDVPVNHTVAVRAGECFCYVLRDLDRFVHGELMLAVQAIAERFSLHVRHHIEQEGVGLTRIEQGQYVRVLQVGGGFDLREENAGPLPPQPTQASGPSMPRYGRA